MNSIFTLILFSIIIFLIALLTLSFKLTLLVIIMFPIVGFIIGYIGKQLQKDSDKVQNQMGKIMSKADETLSGIRTIKSLNISKHIHSIFSIESKKYRKLMNSLLRKKDLSSPMSEFLSTIVLVIVLLIGGTMVLNTKSITKLSQKDKIRDIFDIIHNNYNNI